MVDLGTKVNQQPRILQTQRRWWIYEKWDPLLTNDKVKYSPVWIFYLIICQLFYLIMSIGYDMRKMMMMSKTSEFPIDVFEISYHFGSVKNFWTCSEGEIHYIVKICLGWSSPKSFGAPKIKLDLRNIYWECRSLGHKCSFCFSRNW